MNFITRILLLLGIFIISVFNKINSQNNQVKDIINLIENKHHTKVLLYKIDLDNDNDTDFIFTYRYGEPNYFDIYLNKNKKLIKSISEFGNISFNEKQNISIKSKLHQCCGESPFISYRFFKFYNDEAVLTNNFIKYNEEYYCDDTNLLYLPNTFLKEPYKVEILKNNYNVRFSADLKKHNASFTCFANSNIIAQLKKGASVKVLAKEKRNDKNLRTWLYVEIKETDLNFKNCNTPFAFKFFKNQKLRAWISDKYTKKTNNETKP